MDIRKNLFSERAIRHCNELPRDKVQSPSWEVFKKQVDMVLRNIVQWAALVNGGTG